jgi:hypothetical protein
MHIPFQHHELPPAPRSAIMMLQGRTMVEEFDYVIAAHAAHGVGNTYAAST